ncbi:MAG: SRPBCC family protein [Candidatus Eisenbacteria bacterium]
MRTFELKREQTFGRPIEEVFAFFAAAENLERITPPWLRFRIVSPLPIEMQVGARIDYRLRLHGLPIGWQSEITAWEPPYRFVDEQRRGPYQLWVHEHRFRSDGERTHVVDHVTYAVPGGSIVRDLFVRGELERIFAYRYAVLEREVFPSGLHV